MVKFFQDSQPSRVWDRDQNKVTVVFQKGVFETDDPSLVALLRRVGYRYRCEGELPELASVKTPDVTPVEKVSKKMVRKK